MIETILLIIGLIAFSILLITPFALCLIDRIFKTTYSCCTFGWHNGKNQSELEHLTEEGSDGCSLHAKCSKCGKEVMQDSQGNWF